MTTDPASLGAVSGAARAHTLPFPTPDKLHKAIEAGHRRLEHARCRRKEAIEIVLGPNWDEYNAKRGGWSAKARPLNLTAQLLTILLPYLAFQGPQPSVQARSSALFGEAEVITLFLKEMGEDVNLEETIQDCVVDAILGPFAPIRCHWGPGPHTIDIDGQHLPLTSFYADPFDFDDYVLDPQARRYGRHTFEGHRFRLDRDESREETIGSGLFGSRPDDDPQLAAMMLSPEEAAAFIASMSREGSDGQDTASTRHEEAEERDGIQEPVAFWTVCVRYRGRLFDVTLPATRTQPDRYLRVTPWQGPPEGPYDRLAFYRLPGEPVSLSPELMQRDLANAADRVSNKMIDQMLKAKRVFPYTRGSEDSAQAAQVSKDGGFFAVDDAKSIGQLDMGGVMDGLYQAMGALTEFWNNNTGGLQLVGGQKDVTKSATAFTGMMGRVNASLDFRARKVQQFCSRIYSRMGYYVTEAPLIQKRLPYPLPGGDSVDVMYGDGYRAGRCFDFRFDAEAYSTQHQPPELRMRRLVEALQVYAQFIPLAAQGFIPLRPLADMFRRELNAPEFEELVPDPALAAARLQAMAQLENSYVSPQAPSTAERKRGLSGAPATRPIDDTRSAMAAAVPR